MDIQMVEGIPGPDELEVFVQHHEQIACIRVGSSVHVYRFSDSNRE